MLGIIGLLIGPVPPPANAALVATGINDSYSVRHDRSAFVPASGVLANDLNLLGGATAILVADAVHGTLNLQSDGGFRYTPASGFVGTDTFRYRPSGVLSTAATVTITVTNAAPVANPDAFTWTSGNLFVAAPGVLGNDTDADGDVLVAEMVGGGVSGSLDLGSNGSITYSPGGGFSGSATFSYRTWDGLAWSAPTSVTLTRTASPTPTPVPTAPPATPVPSLLPTPSPFAPVPTPTLPGGVLPTPLSSVIPSPVLPPRSDDPGPDRSPEPSGAPTSSVSAPSDGRSGSSGSGDAQPGNGAAGAGPPSAGDAASARTGGGLAARLPSIEFDEQRLDVSGAMVDLFAGVEIWAVPAATIAVPGLLVLVWLALQGVGAIAWLPAARRLQGGSAVARRRRRRR